MPDREPLLPPARCRPAVIEGTASNPAQALDGPS